MRNHLSNLWRRSLMIGVLSLVVLLSCSLPTTALGYQVPPATGHVNDFANLLLPETEQALETQLTATADKNLTDVRVVTLNSLQGETATAVAQQFFKSWNLGQEDGAPAVIVLVSLDDQALEIVTSQGLQPALDESVKQIIISENIAPAFDATDYRTGIQAGVNTILLYLDDPNTIVVSNDDGTAAAPISSIFTSFMWLLVWYGVFTVGSAGLIWSVAHLAPENRWLCPLLGGVLGGALGQMHGVGLLTAWPFAALGWGSYWIQNHQVRTRKQ